MNEPATGPQMRMLEEWLVRHGRDGHLRRGVELTRAQHRAELVARSAENNAQHQVDKVGENRWRCKRANTSAYSFQVITAPGVICLFGDIGEIILRCNDGDPLRWMARNSSLDIDYVASKLSAVPPRSTPVFLFAEALKELRAMARTEDDALEELRTNAEENVVVPATDSWLAQILEEWNWDEHDGDAAQARHWYEVYYNVTGDPEAPECTDIDPTVQLCLLALMWWSQRAVPPTPGTL